MNTAKGGLREQLQSAAGFGISRILWGAVWLVLIGGFLLILFRMLCVNFVDSYELGYKYDKRTGAVERLMTSGKDSTGAIVMVPRTGYIVTPPFVVSVNTVDLRPMQVCINANSRVLNCKLVKFNPAGLELFLSWHGRSNYDGGNSSTSSSSTTSSKFNQILMSYAYDGSGKVYPFLEIIRELKPEDTVK